MALTVGTLVVKLSADTGQFFTSIGNVLKGVEQFAKKSKEMAGNVAASAGALTAAAGAAAALASTVDGRTAIAVEDLRKKTAHFAVQVADVLAPAMKEMGALFTRAADFVAGLSPQLKASIGHFMEVAAAVAFAAKGFQLLMGVVAPAAQALSALFGLFEGVSFTALATGLVEVVAVLGLVIGAVALVHKAWRLNWGGIQEKTGNVLETIRGWWTDFVNFIGTAYGKLVDGALSWVKAVLGAVDTIREATGVGPSAQDVEGWRMGFEGLAKDLKSGAVFTDSWKAVAKAGKEAFDAVLDEFRLMVKEFGADKAWAKIKDKVKNLFTGGGAARVEVAFQDIFGTFKAQASDAFVESIKAGGVELKKLAGQLWDTFQRNPLAMGRQQRQAAYSDAKQAEAQANVGVGESSWDLAMKALEAASRNGAAFAESLGLWMSRMSGILTSGLTRAMGEVGNLIQAGVQGAQAGGWIGAVVAVFMELLQKTKAVSDFIGKALDFVMKIVEPLGKAIAPIFEALSGILDKLVPIFKTIFDALAPFFDAIAMIISNLSSVFTTIGHLLKSLAPILMIIGKLLQYLSPVIWLIAKALGLVVNIIITVLNPIIALIMEISGNHEGAAALMREIGSSWEDWATKDGPDFNFAANGAADALNGTAAAATAVTEALLNVPSGYKVNEARFAAAIAEGMGPQPGGASGPWSGTGLPRMPDSTDGPWTGLGLPTSPITVQGDLVVQAQDPEDFLRQLNARVGRSNGQRYGTTVAPP